MKKLSSQQGLATAAVVVIVAAIVIGAGVAYYAATRTPATQKAMEDANMLKNDMMVKEEGDTMMKKEDQAMMENDTTVKYSGTVLAGTSAPLLDFTKADFDTALQSDKLIVVYFYANWCPTCAVEFPVMQSAFNELKTDQAIGFRVNYNDSDTDTDEVALAREHGIAYQHTKVFIKNGKQILKSPETWDKQRYLAEITSALK